MQSTTRTPDAVIEKIQKLLSLANSDNEHEAKLAADRAQELILKHNLSIQDLDRQVTDYEERDLTLARGLQHQNFGIIEVLQKYFFVRVLLYNSDLEYALKRMGARVPRKLRFVGRKENVAMAVYLYEYLNGVYPTLWKKYAKENPNAIRQSYMKGLTEGIKENLEKVRFRVQGESGLVLVKDPMIGAIMEKYETRGVGFRSQSTCEESMNRGRTDGSTIQLKKAMTTDTTQSGKYLK